MADSAIKYVGVDGCKAGWIGVGLDDAGCSQVEVRGKFGDLVACFGDARVILVDIPIGLLEEAKKGGRDCDKEARKMAKLRRFKSSIFSAPPRPFVKKVMGKPDWKCPKDHQKPYMDAYEEAKEWHRREFGGKGISSQSFAITPKIGEMDEYLRNRRVDSPQIREAHPEVCFMELSENNQPMTHKKSKREGFRERCVVLRHCARHVDGLDVRAIYEKARREESRTTKLADDDILDAIALAITAKFGWQNGFRRLPEDLSHDCKKPKPPEMVYYVIPNEK